MSKDYWFEEATDCYVVKHMRFDKLYPNGLTRTIFKATFGEDGMFTKEKALELVKDLVYHFNSKKFEREGVSYE